MEAHNLCWKLGYVAKGLADPAILNTYAGERFTVAEKLIRIDRTLVAMYAGLEREGMAGVGENGEKSGGQDGEEGEERWERHHIFDLLASACFRTVKDDPRQDVSYASPVLCVYKTKTPLLAAIRYFHPLK